MSSPGGDAAVGIFGALGGAAVLLLVPRAQQQKVIPVVGFFIAVR